MLAVAGQEARPRKQSRDTAPYRTMLEGKAVVEDTDMPAKMQAQAMSAASRALDRFDVLDCRSIAAHIKMVCMVTHLHPNEIKLCSRVIGLSNLDWNWMMMGGACRSLTRSMGLDGNAWWVPASAATSRTARGASSTSASSRSGSSSSKARQRSKPTAADITTRPPGKAGFLTGFVEGDEVARLLLACGYCRTVYGGSSRI